MSSSSAKLPILPLPHPTVLLPGSRITLTVPVELGEALLTLIEAADALPVVAAVPVASDTDTNSLAEHGVAARILRLVRPPGRNSRQSYLLTLHGLTRIRLSASFTPDPDNSLVPCEVQYPPNSKDSPPRKVVDTFKQSAHRLLDRLAQDSGQQIRRDGYSKISAMLEDVTDARAAWMADILVGTVNASFADKLSILSTTDPEARLVVAAEIFSKLASISEVTSKIATQVEESVYKQQKEHFLRQQLAAIHKELQSLSGPGNLVNGQSSELDDDEQHEADDLADLKRRIEAMEPGSEERKMGVREWRRLKRIPQGSVENGVIRSYLEWLTAIPWSNSTSETPRAITDRSFLTAAREQLDADHFGLEKIKKRLIEYLAVVRLKEMNAERERQAAAAILPKVEEKSNVDDTKDKTTSPPIIRPTRKSVKGPILLFVGPPGTGKTSLGQSIAKALNRPFQRISLGGVRDEGEIRGHRRTYVASGPGLIVQALRKAGRSDPVFLLHVTPHLDEIDKIGGSNFHGDPSAALLEVLDPEQNHTFNDHYINVPVDLSQVLFICTANSLETISGPLLDRCEVVQLSGYTYDEKMHIARRFLLPKQLKQNGMDADHVQIAEPALMTIATRYTREAGVRSLERAIGAVTRYKAVEWAEHIDAQATGSPKPYSPVVQESELEAILGIARWDAEEREREERRGVVYGLVVMGQGEGGILPVETIAVPGAGRLKLTGSLGEVIKESGEIALSWVKTHAYDLCITESRAQDPLKVPELIDIHLHLPAGAQKKDGPSAGIAMACAFVSLLTGARVPANIAMTGEITLRGRVTPVGGIKEKVLGAHRAQISKVILPWANRKDVEHDVAPEIQRVMEFVFVRTVNEALEAAFGKDTLGWRNGISGPLMLESRL
ncbi:Lon protease-like protein [Mycena indigotica]|uniref:Lon protease homolog n=1 Tax=Mycena indigotica TaxID=2126181 RepID=A0A8H6T285_9AGAR|nr:Lon protease-like protein [Mycena indigotica]KAF7309696.1 Lon protease-like protein [Mycena indigotica]